MSIQSRFVLSVAALVGVTGCSASSGNEAAQLASTTVVAPTTVATSSTSTTTLPVASAFAATPTEFEARVEVFGRGVGGEIGAFAPIQNSKVIGAPAGDHAVGYYLDGNDRVIAAAVYVPIADGQQPFSTPAQLVSIITTAGVASDDIDAAIEVFRREVLEDLSTLTSGVTTFEGGPPFFMLTAAIDPTGVLFVAQPPDGSQPPIGEFRQRLSTLIA